MKQVHDTFADGALPYWNRFAVGRAWVQEAPGVVRFAMGPAPEGALSDAELNDFRLFGRGKWPWRAPLRLTVRARASHDAECLVTAAFSEWHVYRLEWLAASVDFWVDEQKILSTAMAPRGPLGFVAWIDNSMLRLREGEFAFANLAVAEREWLELSEVRIESLETPA